MDRDRLAAGEDRAVAVAPTADTVEVVLPAREDFVPMLRNTAAALAARMEFNLDEIDDLRIAVDEACALLLARAGAGSDLRGRFGLDGDVVTAAVSVAADTPDLPEPDSLGWMVLTALAGPVEVTARSGRVELALAKRKVH